MQERLPPLITNLTPLHALARPSRLKQPQQRSLSFKTSIAPGVTLPLLATLVCNQEEEIHVEEEKSLDFSSCRTSRSSRSSRTIPQVKDKNRDFIKDLEEKKRKEQDECMRRERRKKKRHEQMTRKLLAEATARQKQVTTCSEVDNLSVETVRSNELEADHETERKEKALRQKRLLKKQRAHLEQMQANQREEQERRELERAREQRKREKVTQTVLQTLQDAANRHDTIEDEIPSSFEGALNIQLAAEPAQTEAQKQREALQRKQQQYLQKLSDQRKQKEKDDEEARLSTEKRKRRIQKEAHQRLQDAAQALAEARAKEDAVSDNPVILGPTVDVEAMVARLSKWKDRDFQIMPEARDFVSWKKRHGVAEDQKVFAMTGWYPVIREELEKRGWFYNQDRTSPYFDLKWTLKSDELRALKLEKHQYVNHFTQNAAITTKVGLIHNLRSAVWHHSVDIDGIFPRAYDLNDLNDMDTFVQDFRFGVAEGLLKQLARRGLQQRDNVREGGSIEANEAVIAVILDVVRKKIQSKRPDCNNVESRSSCEDLDESVDDPLSTGLNELVTDLEWEVLSTCSLDGPGRLPASLVYKQKGFEEERMEKDGKVGVDTVLSAQRKRSQRSAERIHADAFNREKSRLQALLLHVSPVPVEVFDAALRLAQELEKVCPQFHINGGAEFMLSEPHPAAATSTSQNVWIVKPAGMSRGRGIRVFNELPRLLEYVDVDTHKECQWVAQKYIENPFLVCRRKFDLRQWVLVTGWDPLIVWFHKDCYLRFSSEEFSMEDLSDQYVHLTNNSIQKYSEKFNDVYATDDGEMQVKGNMWHSDEFKQYLSTQRDKEASWDAHIHPRMKEIVVQSLQCVQDMVQHRSNSCELYGYDFMVDEELNPWLIEVNSSPACDYSTPTAQRYVESGLSGIIKVVVDYREYEQQKRNGTGAGLSEPDTGCWQRIHKGEYVGKPMAAFAVDFHVKGSKMHRGRRNNKVSDGKADYRTKKATSESRKLTNQNTEVESAGIPNDDTGIDPLL